MEKAACQAYICGHKCGMPASDPIHSDSPDINIIAHPFEGITAEEREESISLELESKALLQAINAQIKQIEKEHEFEERHFGHVAGHSIFERKYADGKHVMAPLLAAKAQAIHAIALLKGNS